MIGQPKERSLLVMNRVMAERVTIASNELIVVRSPNLPSFQLDHEKGTKRGHLGHVFPLPIDLNLV